MTNVVFLIGRVGSQPEIRTTENTKIASFSLATSEKWKDKVGNKQEKTTWHNIVIFGNLANVVETYVNKGDLIHVQGKIQIDEYQSKEGEKKYAYKINANNMQMLGSPGESKPQSKPQGNSGYQPDPLDSEDDQLPF